MNNLRTFRDRLQKRIHEKVVELMDGRTQTWLAEKSGIPLSTIHSAMTKGTYTIEVLARIAPPLGTTVSELAGEVGTEMEDLDPEVAKLAMKEIERVIEQALVISGRQSEQDAQESVEDVEGLPRAGGARALAPDDPDRENRSAG